MPKDLFPVLNIHRMIDAMIGHEIMSLLDAYSGYNQIRIDLDDQEKTSFITNFDTYCYNVIPFGLKNAKATYQRLVKNCLKNKLSTKQ